jgi:hypothetical protein
MSGLARRRIKNRSGCQPLWWSLLLTTLIFAGCFGAQSMHYDVQQYNKEVLSSEQEMLLYNLAALHQGEEPHFMMVSNIAQTRSYSAGLSFTFSNLWNKLFLPASATAQTKGSNTYAVNSTVSAVENPTITFVPIQGQDFANRFESPLSDKLYLFLEDLNGTETYTSWTQTRWLLFLFVQNIDIRHASPLAPCYNSPENQFSRPSHGFQDCLDYFADKTKFLDQIEASHPILNGAKTKDPPTATEEVSALQANYKWINTANEAQLAIPVSIPAFFDFDAQFVSPPPESVNPSEQLRPIWWGQQQVPFPNKNIAYMLPSKYQWHQWQQPKNLRSPYKNWKFVVTPDGYEPQCKADGSCELVREDKTNLDDLDAISYGDKIIRYEWPYPYDEVYAEFRNKEEIGARTAQVACTEHRIDDSEYKRRLDNLESQRDLKNKQANKNRAVDVAEQKLKKQYTQPGASSRDLLCGYMKIGNLLQIMQSLADSACTTDPPDSSANRPACDQSVVGFGTKVPSYAIAEAPFSNSIVPKRKQKLLFPPNWVWVPAHDPHYRTKTDSEATEQELENKCGYLWRNVLQWKAEATSPLPQTTCGQRQLGERDKFIFFTLYKLYQESLVDTSKLVTGSTPITISK